MYKLAFYISRVSTLRFCADAISFRSNVNKGALYLIAQSKK